MTCNYFLSNLEFYVYNLILESHQILRQSLGGRQFIWDTTSENTIKEVNKVTHGRVKSQ